MNRLPATSFVLAVALFAVLLAAASFLRAPGKELPARLDALERQVRSVGEAVERAERSLAPLAREIAALRAETRALAARLPAVADSSALPQAAVEPAAEDASSELLRERMETLIARLDEAAARPLVVAPGLAVGAAAETTEVRARIVEENQAAALDRSLTTENRLQALRELRSRDGRSRDVTLAMLEIIEDPATPSNLRADIIRNLDGVTFDELEAPLLRILSEDPDPETRAETVETLQVFYDRPHVYAAVVQVRDGDKDPRVRAEAFERLARYGPIHPR